MSALNIAFSRERIESIRAASPEAFAPGTPLVDGLRAAGVELRDSTAEFVATFPTALQEAVRAILHENLTREGTVPVTFAWAPGYDYELQAWDVRDTTETAGGITILVRTRYPDDPHPLTKPAATAS